jgi:hypothetical protein
MCNGINFFYQKVSLSFIAKPQSLAHNGINCSI